MSKIQVSEEKKGLQSMFEGFRHWAKMNITKEIYYNLAFLSVFQYFRFKCVQTSDVHKVKRQHGIKL